MKERYVRNGLLLFLIALSMSAVGQDGKSGAGTPSNIVSADQAARYVDLNQEPDDLRQELDADAIALSKIPSDPILKPDPFGIFLDPFERLTDRINQSASSASM